MKYTLSIFILVLGLISCNNNDKFTVGGSIKDAEGKLLFLEHAALEKTTIIDSVELSEDGNFKFKSSRPLYPDFYNLRLENKTIVFAVDSCEKINIESKFENFASDYNITGSETSTKIKTLRLSVINIQRKVNSIHSDLTSEKRNALFVEIEQDIEKHKKMAQQLVLQNPRSLAAYFAIYQKINNTYLFSPYIKTDKPFYAAVATSFNTFMPEYDRSKNIYSLVMDAIKTERSNEQQKAWKEILDTKGLGYIDITLNDAKLAPRKLSELEGKVVLLDFSAYENEQSVEYTFALRELYNKYHSRGFEIYQVSLDQNKLLWENSISTIPWICVRHEDGPANPYLLSYNVKSLPTNFLMNRQGTIIARSLNFNEMKKAIEKSL